MKLTKNLCNYNKLKSFYSLNDYRFKYLNLWIHDRLTNFENSDISILKSEFIRLSGDFTEKKNALTNFWITLLMMLNEIKKKYYMFMQ